MTRSDGHVRTLILPSGGTMDIPLPGTNIQRFAIRPGNTLSDATHSPKLSLVIGLVLGAAIGVGVTVWYLKHK